MVSAPGLPSTTALPSLPPLGFPGAASPGHSPAVAPAFTSPWAMQDGFQFAGARGADPFASMQMQALKILVDQALLAMLVSFFERQQGMRTQDRGAMRGGGGSPMRRTSWRPSAGGSSSGAPSSGGAGRPAHVDTRAPARLDQLPQGERSVGRFLNAALAQNGDEYEYAAGRNLNDADPDEFDCSGLVYWSLHQAGIDPDTVGGYSGAQAAGSRRISVDEALRTPGALLFKPGHVAISLGDGRTIEAMGERWGVKIADANGRGWTQGGLIPGMDYGGSIGVVP